MSERYSGTAPGSMLRVLLRMIFLALSEAPFSHLYILLCTRQRHEFQVQLWWKLYVNSLNSNWTIMYLTSESVKGQMNCQGGPPSLLYLEDLHMRSHLYVADRLETTSLLVYPHIININSGVICYKFNANSVGIQYKLNWCLLTDPGYASLHLKLKFRPILEFNPIQTLCQFFIHYCKCCCFLFGDLLTFKKKWQQRRLIEKVLEWTGEYKRV